MAYIFMKLIHKAHKCPSVISYTEVVAVYTYYFQNDKYLTVNIFNKRIIINSDKYVK